MQDIEVKERGSLRVMGKERVLVARLDERLEAQILVAGRKLLDPGIFDGITGVRHALAVTSQVHYSTTW